MDFFESSGFKIYLAVTGAAAVLAFVITAAVMLPGYIGYKKSLKSAEHTGTEKTSGITDDLLIPEKYSVLINPSMKSFYDEKFRLKEPSDSEYWVDPSSMMLKYLEEKNSNLIKEILEKYE